MSSPVSDLLRARIAKAGPIPFRDFMEAALYHPEHGYYAAARARIGRSGDFITNVSVGPLFGKLLALQLVEWWARLGRPRPFTVVEQGAHGGVLCGDILRALGEAAPGCFSAVRYLLVEPFEGLRRAQSHALRTDQSKVEWCDSVEALDPFIGVHLSNELIDAFPVHLLQWSGKVWRERYVDHEHGRFVFANGPLSSGALHAHLSRLPPRLPPGYQTEINLAALAWPQTLATKLRRGYLLTIDYGYARADYYAPEREQGTLSAVARHRRELDPLTRPGEIDLTAHVDFTSLVEASEEAGFRLAGFTDQHHFMVGLGSTYFDDRIELTPAHEQELRAFKMLMHPGLMGLSFKVLLLEKGLDSGSSTAGFALARDPRHALGL